MAEADNWLQFLLQFRRLVLGSMIATNGLDHSIIIAENDTDDIRDRRNERNVSGQTRSHAQCVGTVDAADAGKSIHT